MGIIACARADGVVTNGLPILIYVLMSSEQNNSISNSHSVATAPSTGPGATATTINHSLRNRSNSQSAIPHNKYGNRETPCPGKHKEACVVYPEACDSKPVYCYAYWSGVQVSRHEHGAMCRLTKGNTIIFSCGDPGSGKSTSVNSIVHTTARLETAA
jgi:hypothetical protein